MEFNLGSLQIRFLFRLDQFLQCKCSLKVMQLFSAPLVLSPDSARKQKVLNVYLGESIQRVYHKRSHMVTSQ